MFKKIKQIALTVWEFKVEVGIATVSTAAFLCSIFITPWIGVVFTGIITGFAIWLLVLVWKDEI